MKSLSVFKAPGWVVWSLALALSQGFCAETASEDPLIKLLGDPVVARGKGFEIKSSQLQAEVIRTKEMLALTQQPANADLDRQVLDRMINVKLLLGEATDADRAKAREQFDKQLNTFKTERKITDEEFNTRLAPELKMQRRTRADWEQQQIEQLTMIAVVQRELNAPLTEEQAKKYYESNVPKFEEPELARVAHILISLRDMTDLNANPLQRRELPEEQKKAKRKLAEDLVKRGRAGEDFKKMAQDYSDDPEAKKNGGEISLIRDARAPEEFKAAAFALKNTNDVSDVVTTLLGYHVIKLLDRIPARKEPYAGLDTKTVLPKVDGTKLTIREALNEETIQKEAPGLVKKLREAQSVEILERRLRGPDDSTATASGSK